MKKIISIAFILAAMLCIKNAGYAQCTITSASYLICESISNTNNTLTMTKSGTCGAGVESWGSTNTSVATATGSGPGTATVTGVNPGTAVITYSVSGTQRATRMVTVAAVTTPTVTGTSSICYSGTPTVTLNGTPSSGGVWQSGNTSIATVGSGTGVVTGVAMGTVDITYFHTNSSNCTHFVAYPVTVDPAPSGGSITGPLMMWGGIAGVTTFTVTGAVGTSGAWSSSVTAVGSVDASTGVVTPRAVGTTNISYTATNACGSASSSVSVTVNPYPTARSGGYGSVSPSAAFGTSGCGTVDGLNAAYMSGAVLAFTYRDASAGTSELYTRHTSMTPGSDEDWKNQSNFSGSPNNTPDVVIANGDYQNIGSATRFSFAVAYPTSNMVRVDVFNYDASGITWNYGTRVCVYVYSCTPTSVHIDGIADASSSNNTRYGVVTWEAGGTVYAERIDLLAGLGTYTMTPVSIASGKDPDVAAIKRNISGSGVQEYALITYTDASNDLLYYAEWEDIVPGGARTVSSPVTLDNMGVSSTVSRPRIDAIDDDGINDPVGATDAVYKVVAEVYNNSTGRNEVRTYDNLLGGGVWWTSSNVVNHYPTSGIWPFYDHFAPTVAYVGADYIVPHFTTVGSDDVVFMEPVPIDQPSILADDAYYWVSRTTTLTATPAHAVAAAPYQNGGISGSGIIAWAYPNPGLTCDEIEWDWAIASGYPFKPDPPRNLAQAKNEQWIIYPNPTRGNIIVGVPENKAGSYELADMLGRMLMKGELKEGNQRLGLAELPPGQYVLKLHGADGSAATEMIVKE